MGMNPRKSPFYPQMPPRKDNWLDIVRLLVDHGASVHEVVLGRSITMLNITRYDTRPRTLEFFHLLQKEVVY